MQVKAYPVFFIVWIILVFTTKLSIFGTSSSLIIRVFFSFCWSYFLSSHENKILRRYSVFVATFFFFTCVVITVITEILVKFPACSSPFLNCSQ